MLYTGFIIVNHKKNISRQFYIIKMLYNIFYHDPTRTLKLFKESNTMPVSYFPK